MITAELSKTEANFVNDFRKLSKQGKKYMLAMMECARDYYKDNIVILPLRIAEK